MQAFVWFGYNPKLRPRLRRFNRKESETEPLVRISHKLATAGANTAMWGLTSTEIIE